MKSLTDEFKVIHISVRLISSNILTSGAPSFVVLWIFVGDLPSVLSKQHLKSLPNTVRGRRYSSNTVAILVQNEGGGELGAYIHHSNMCPIYCTVDKDVSAFWICRTCVKHNWYGPVN